MEKQTLINQLIKKYNYTLNRLTNWLKSIDAEKITKGVKKGATATLSAGLITSMLMTAGCNKTPTPAVDDTTVTTEAPVETELPKLLENYDPNYACDFTSDLGVQLAQTENYKENIEEYGKVHDSRFIESSSVSLTPSGYFKSLGLSEENINYNTGVRADLITDDSLYLMTYITDKVLKDTPEYAQYGLIAYHNLPKEVISDLMKNKTEKNMYNYANLVRAISQIYTPEVITKTYVVASGSNNGVEGTGDNVTVKSAGIVVDENGKKVIYAFGINSEGNPVLAKSVTDWKSIELEALKEINSSRFHVSQTSARFSTQTNYEILDEGIQATMRHPTTTKYKEPQKELEKNS